jgi:hypothetical protein
MLHTEDGGSTWQAQDTWTQLDLRCVTESVTACESPLGTYKDCSEEDVIVLNGLSSYRATS